MSKVASEVRWPILAMLGALLGLCLVAPAQWRRIPPAGRDVAAGRISIARSADHLPPGATGRPASERPSSAETSPTAAMPDNSVQLVSTAPFAPEPEQPAPDMAPPETALRPAVTQEVNPVAAPGHSPVRRSDAPAPQVADESDPPGDRGGWPLPADVIARLQALTSDEQTRPWAGELLCVLDDLRGGGTMTAEDFAAVYGHLLHALAEASRLEARVTPVALAAEVTRTRLAIERRAEAWRALHAISLAARVERAAGNDRLATRDPLSIVVAKPAKQILADDATALLHSIEAYEAAPTAESARLIVAAVDRFSRENDAAARKLADHLASHYRNANLRVAAHAALLNRLLPQPTETGGSVNDFVAGVPVRGRQFTRTRLLLRLIPDERNIRLGLEAHGEVDSDTAAHSGPATLYTSGETRFLARKLLVLDERRWRVFPAIAAAQADTALTGVRTDFDGLPILNSIVHNIVRSKHDERRWQAQREVEDRVSSEARARLDAEADAKLAGMATRATETFTEPMRRLGLEPTPVTLATTDDRTTFRYRLAGKEQLGGHTPRPRAPADSWLSVQLHESAINNALDNLKLAGQTFELRELYESVAARLDRPDITVPDDVPHNVYVTFAAENPVQIRLIDNKAEVTLRLARIKADRKTWRDLTVIAVYAPRAGGLAAQFVRDQPIGLSGSKLTTRSSVVLRGVFTKMFTRNRRVDLLPEAMANDARLADLAVTQLVVHDGWMGLAIARRAADVGPEAVPDAESAEAARKAVRK